MGGCLLSERVPASTLRLGVLFFPFFLGVIVLICYARERKREGQGARGIRGFRVMGRVWVWWPCGCLGVGDWVWAAVKGACPVLNGPVGRLGRLEGWKGYIPCLAGGLRRGARRWQTERLGVAFESLRANLYSKHTTFVTEPGGVKGNKRKGEKCLCSYSYT